MKLYKNLSAYSKYFLFTLAVAFAANAFAVIILKPDGSDPREVLPENELYGAGRLDVLLSNATHEGNFYASANLINECLIITNKHTIHLENFNTDSITFKTGIDLSLESKAQVVAEGIFIQNNYHTFPEDWAILKLDKPLGKQVGYLTPMYQDENDLFGNNNLSIAGTISNDYEATVAAGIFEPLKIHRNCTFYGWTYNITADNKNDFFGTVWTDCSSMPVASGSAVRKLDRKNKPRMVGIAKNGKATIIRPEERTLLLSNVMIPFVAQPRVPISLTIERMVDIINNNPCSPNQKKIKARDLR